jgi:hypothetical protein
MITKYKSLCGYYLWITGKKNQAHKMWSETLKLADEFLLIIDKYQAHLRLSKFPLENQTTDDVSKHKDTARVYRELMWDNKQSIQVQKQ